ncbi:YesL family protein, partial [Collinsella aerofaciens]|nr:YesL family protein [Collinsella aerofaciens]
MSSKGAGLIKTVFNTDNVVMRISEKVLDLVTVNLLFVLSCLPVLTIGIAKISLYQTLFAIKHQRRVPVIRSYAKAFRDNWKIGLQLGSLELIVAGICLFDLFLFWGQTSLAFQALKT